MWLARLLQTRAGIRSLSAEMADKAEARGFPEVAQRIRGAQEAREAEWTARDGGVL